MERRAKIRALEMEHEVPPESESDVSSVPPPTSPARRIAGNLSSMVVKPSASDGGGSDLDAGYAADNRTRDSPPPLRRRYSPQGLQRRDSPSYGRSRGGSSPFHRRGSYDAFRRRVSQHGLRRASPMGFHRRVSPPGFHPRPQRFHDGPGYMQRPGSISPLHRPRVDDGSYGPDFDHPAGPRPGRGMRGRGGGRFRDISPTALGRVGRPYSRGFNSSAREKSPFEGELVHRNDPNLSPREGDWICRNPSCGNLNFARRTYCNNCHKYRFDEPYESSHSPRGGYISPPPPHGFSPRLPVVPIDRGSRRDFNGYRSPPHSWDSDDPKDIRTGIIPPRRGAKIVEPVRRDRPNFREDDFRERDRSNWHVSADWGRRGQDAFVSDRRGLERNPLSPHDRWIRDTRDRSRSPIASRFPRGSFVGRGRDDRRYDGPYMVNGRTNDLGAARGRGYRRGIVRRMNPDVY